MSLRSPCSLVRIRTCSSSSGPLGYRRRLRTLAARYSLVGGGELHPTVRYYLRRHWRVEERPPIFDRVLLRIENIANTLPTLADHDVAALLDRRLLQVTLLSWRDYTTAPDHLARALALALAHDTAAASFVELLRELVETHPGSVKLPSLLPNADQWDQLDFDSVGKHRLTRWLFGVAHDSGQWSLDEQACLTLLEGLGLPFAASDEEARSCLISLLRAVKHFTPARVPRSVEVASTLHTAASRLLYEETGRWRTTREYLSDAPLLEEAYLAAITLVPTNGDVFNDLGNVHNQLGRQQDAERAYRKAVELSPRSGYPRDNLGRVLRNIGKYQEAELEFLKAVELDPTDPRPLRGLAILYMDYLGRPHEAEPLLQRATEVDPNDGAAQRVLGKLYDVYLSRPGDAEREYRRAIELNAKDDGAWVGLGALFDRAGRVDDAEHAYAKAAELNPRSAAAHLNLGSLYSKQGRMEAAERAYLRAAELDSKQDYRPGGSDTPKPSYPHMFLAYLYSVDLDRPYAAEHALLKALEFEPDSVELSHALGNLYQYGLSRPGDAERAYRRSLELDPKNVGARYSLVFLYLVEGGNLSGAREEFRRCVDTVPDTFGAKFCGCALQLWEAGWDRARQALPDVLAAAGDGDPDAWPGELSDFIREVIRRGGLADLAAMLEIASVSPWWRPWAEAVSALREGGPPSQWQHRRAERLFTTLLRDDTSSRHSARGV